MWTSRSLSIDRHHPPLSLTTRRMGSSQLLTHGFRPLQLRYFTVSTSPSPYRILTQNCFFCHSSLPPPPLSLSSFFTSSASTRLLARGRNLSRRSTSGESESVQERDELGEVEQKGEEEVAGILLEGNMKEREANAGRIFSAVMEAIPEENSAVASACLVGLLTGIGVVLFNNGVHELRDFFWDGIPYRGASWLREEPIAVTWKKIVLVPVCGGVLVSFLNTIRDATEVPSTGVLMTRVKAVARPVLKSLAACITLGTGNSLGPEGPSVEIGSSIANGVGTLLDKSAQRKVSLMAAGSAAGISSGFNAAVAGCFFAVESVLWPSPSNSSTSLLNTTSMVILSAVTASVISAVGLGSEPAFKVPNYDFRSPTELPLYLFLGILCGLVSLALSRCTTYMLQAAEHINISGGVPKSVFPIGGSLAVGLIALAYPEILYWGFQNVDLLLESRPFVKGLPADLLLQLVVVKIIATSLCRASGLVGGYYAPSLFIGAATGMAYGKFLNIAISQSHPVLDISFFEVASPQAYALVGMAATLAGVCQVPLTSVLLLFELTQDYRIVLPLLGAVGLSTWITSTLTKEDTGDSKDLRKSPLRTAKENESDSDFLGNGASSISDALCDLESSLCVDISDEETRDLERRISVLQAMRTNHVIIFLSTFLVDAVDMMLAAKQPCALIIDDATYLIGLLSLEDIEDFCKCETSTSKKPEELVVADMYSMVGQKYHPLCVVTPNTSLMRAQMLMSRHSMSHMPVVLLDSQDSRRGQPVGIIDMEGIKLACRAVAAKEYLNQNFEQQEP